MVLLFFFNLTNFWQRENRKKYKLPAQPLGSEGSATCKPHYWLSDILTTCQWLKLETHLFSKQITSWILIKSVALKTAVFLISKSSFKHFLWLRLCFRWSPCILLLARNPLFHWCILFCWAKMLHWAPLSGKKKKKKVLRSCGAKPAELKSCKTLPCCTQSKVHIHSAH